MKSVVLQPSEAVKDGLLKRNKRLADVIADSMKPLSVAAKRDNQGLSANIAILKVDEELEIVILDKGTRQASPNSGSPPSAGASRKSTSRAST